MNVINLLDVKILQIIIQDRTVLLFTENPAEDVVALKEAFTNDDATSPFGFPLGYEAPELTKYTFLGADHQYMQQSCISLWFDNEDVPDFFTDFAPTV